MKQPQRRPRTKRLPLTRERITLAAIDLMDREGFAAFSMRKLARALHVEAMSLYEHYDSKEAILLSMRSHFYAQLDFPMPPGTPWDEHMHAIITANYKMGVEHSCFIDVHLHVLSVPESKARGQRDKAKLMEAGFSEEQAMFALAGLVAFMLGFLHRTVLVRHPSSQITPANRDEAFEMGLRAMLHGLKQQLRASSAPAKTLKRVRA